MRSVETNLTPEITAEIRLVLERFGVHDEIDLTDTSQVNRLLESRGADIYLLCTIGSWRDTLPDVAGESVAGNQIVQEGHFWISDHAFKTMVLFNHENDVV